MRYLLLTMMCMCGSGLLTAQDQLVLTDGHSRTVWLVEVSETEVLFYETETRDGPLQRLPTQRVRSIQFASGGSQSIQPWTGQVLPPSGQDFTQVLALDILSFGFGYVGLHYERKLTPRIRMAVHGALIGLSSDPNYQEPFSWFRSLQAEINGNTIPYTAYRTEIYEPSQGFFLKAGPKVMLAKTPRSFQGAYVQPQLLFTRYSRSQRLQGGNNHPVPEARQEPFDLQSDFLFSHVGFATNLGYQHLFFHRLSFDVYLGMGVARSTWQEEETNLLTGEKISIPAEEVRPRYVFRYNHIGFDAFGSPSPVILNFGLNMGWAF